MLLMCCRLQELGVSCCGKMTDRGLLEGIGSLQELTSLCLKDGNEFTDQALSTFLHRPTMASIVSLNLSYVDDEGLKGIAKRCNKFTYLNVVQVSGCGCEVSLLFVCVYRCVHLKELTIGHSDNEPVIEIYSISDDGISMVITHCNQLRILNLIGLRDITGMCALCEVPEPTLCCITLWRMILLEQVHH
jgi:hypothetical protein